MSFVLSKVLWYVVQPTNLLLWLLLVAWILRWRGRERAAVRLATLATVGLLLLGLLPLGPWLASPLENRFPLQSSLPARLDGIILLGGPEAAALSLARGQPQLGDGAERFMAAADLARRAPKSRLLFTSGSGDLTGDRIAGATVAASTLGWLGIAAERVTLEGNSRNTWENATMSLDLIRPDPDETWILVTSAMHMPRAMGCFRAAGWPGRLIAWPVDYQSAPRPGFTLGRDLGHNAAGTERALKAWVGLIAYALLGRTDALLPAPIAAEDP